MNDKEDSRVIAYHQLKKEIRGSNNHLLVGIDVAKNKHNAFFGTATGKTLLRRLIFDNSREGFERLRGQAEALKVENDLEKVVYGMEPTANYHKPLGEYLIKNGEEVVLVSGVSVNKNRELLDGRWDKNDTKDSANVGDLISQGKCLYYDYPSLEIRDLRNLLSLKRRLKKQEHSTRVRIRNHLIAQYFPELDKYYGIGSEGLAIVKWCLDPAVISGFRYEDFMKLIAPRNMNINQKRRLRAIWETAICSIGCEAGGVLDFEAKIMIGDLEHIKKAIKAVEDQIKDICLNFPEYKFLLTIPGFGPDISSKVLGAIGNPFRFSAGKQVLKMAGLDLSASRSGSTSESSEPVLSKRGKAYLRYALYQSAFIASITNEYFRVYFTNKLRGRERERGIKTKMRVKLAA
ncbi:MAG: IS110 family transposase, partial [Halobacteriota archaeon]|nr:IS110 family transposase [Halobacteriota archaeon]